LTVRIQAAAALVRAFMLVTIAGNVG